MTELSEENKVLNELTNGIEIREYAIQLEKDIQYNNSTFIQDCITETENIGKLHHELNECDVLLARIEELSNDSLDIISNINKFFY